MHASRLQSVSELGYWCGVAATAATVTFDVVQLLQLAGVLRFPFDEILIYGASLAIVVPFVLEILALHYLTPPERQFFSHAAVVFTVLYAIFVATNYVVQLATVLPAKLADNADAVRVLEQTPHSLFWDFDALGYISMGVACLLAVPALGQAGVERSARRALLANALVTPLIAVVYFYPTYSETLLFLGFPWAITAPLSMGLLAVALRRKKVIR